MRAPRAAVAASAVAALVLPAPAVADPPTPSQFEVETTDTRLCPFPVRVHFAGRQQDHVVAPGGQFAKEMITGPVRITLQNLSTGYTVELEPVGQGNVTITEDSLILDGRQVLTVAGIPSVPIMELRGQTVARLDTFTVVSQTGVEELIDVCRLLAPGTPPAVARTSPAPWDAPADVLGGMALADLTPAWFNPVVHHHAHLDVIVNGSPVPIPAGIGVAEPFTTDDGEIRSVINIAAQVHTHRDDGVLHIQADGPPLTMTLGNFFDIWLVRLTSECLGAYCAGDGNTLRAFVNGALVSGDPREIPVRDGDQITVVYGPA